MGHCLERVCARCDMRVWPLCDVTSAAPSLLQNRYTIALVFSFPPLRLSLSLSPFLPLYYLTCSSRCLSLSLFLFVSTIRWFVDRKGTEECMRALARENLDATRLSSRGRCFSAWGIRFTKKRIPVVLSLSLSHVSSPYPLHYEHVSAELSFPGTCSGGWTRWKDQRFIPIRVPLSKSESRHVTEAGSSIFLFSVPLPLSPPLYRLPSRKNFFSSALNGRLRVLENIRITGGDT